MANGRPVGVEAASKYASILTKRTRAEAETTKYGTSDTVLSEQRIKSISKKKRNVCHSGVSLATYYNVGEFQLNLGDEIFEKELTSEIEDSKSN